MRRIKEYNHLVLTFMCASCIIGVIFYIKNVLPFNKYSLLTIDFFHQYGPMMGELYDRIIGGDNLIYSFSMGIGLPFFRNFFNYLSSPFNIIIFLFNRYDLLTSYSFIISFKTVVSSISMCLFLSKKFGKNYLFVPLSLLYAFSSYFLAYYWNIMWLDGMILLPIITLGIERLISLKRPILYITSLIVMLYSNYFIGYMLCIYSVLYFITYLIINTDKINKDTFKKIFLFITSSLIAGGICAIFLIPMYSSLRGISATGDTMPFSQYYDFTFLEFVFNHLTGISPTVLKSDIINAPNISTGIIPVGLFIAFIFNKNINIKTKIAYLSLLILITLSFYIAPIDYIWHAFHVPNDLPYRYSFIYSFIFIVIAAYEIKSYNKTNIISGLIIYLLMLLYITFASIYSTNISHDIITLNYILISILFICFILSKYKKIRFINYSILLIACCTSIIISMDENWQIDQNSENFYKNYDEVRDKIELISSSDNDMYRIEKDDMLTFNDSSWYKYFGITSFSSMEYESVASLMNYLGLQSNEINSYHYKPNTPIFNVLFNLRYYLGYTYLYDYDEFDEGIYKSNYTGNLMYASENDLKKIETDSYYPFYLQNSLIEYLTNVSDVLKEIPMNDVNVIYQDDAHTVVKYDFINNYDNIYMYLDNGDVDYFVFENNLYHLTDDYDYGLDFISEEIYNTIDYNEKYIISEISNLEECSLYVAYNYYDGDIYDVYEIDYERWNKAYEILKSNILNVDNFSDNYIYASYDFDDEKSVFTSIPYDEGWSLYIDDVKADTYKLEGALLAFDVPSGKHTIKLKYTLPYINVGAVISLVSLLSLVIYLLFNHKKKIS